MVLAKFILCRNIFVRAIYIICTTVMFMKGTWFTPGNTFGLYEKCISAKSQMAVVGVVAFAQSPDGSHVVSDFPLEKGEKV